MIRNDLVPDIYPILAARADATADRFLAAGRRPSLALQARYDPSQPRHPAGIPEGGRWRAGIGSDVVAGPDVDEQDRCKWLASLHEPPRSDVVRASGILSGSSGDPVLNIYGEQILFPLGFRTDQVLDAAEATRSYLEDGNTIEIGLAKLGNDLVNFRQGGEWDVQRYPGRFTWEYRDYSTVLIGMYGERVGMHPDMMLFIENSFAGKMSKFWKFEPMNPTFTSLPERNVFNTMLGYRLGRGGR